jgi:hypothetical protein
MAAAASCVVFVAASGGHKDRLPTRASDQQITEPHPQPTSGGHVRLHKTSVHNVGHVLPSHFSNLIPLPPSKKLKQQQRES